MIHQDNNKKRPDSDFYPGHLKYLVKGNSCRLLDGRRTPGYIGEIFKDEGMFRFCISDYEDKGRYWDLNIERVENYQFDKSSSTCNYKDFKVLIESFDKDLTIEYQTFIEDKSYFESAKAFIESKYMPQGPLDYKDEDQMSQIHEVFKIYMLKLDLWELEKLSQELMVLNPSSGEWFKGLYIVMAEMGLCNYRGKIPRTKSIFEGMGTKEKRKTYIMTRRGFVQALFDHYNLSEVTLYRGMSSEGDFKKVQRSLLNMTFSFEVASAFSDMTIEKYRTSYIIKQTLPVDTLFMTCYETHEMNQRYKEKEAIIFYKDSIEI
ncbi:hypothetical protein EZV73_01235 [Acidaminobacter sp. JC074]|uniref:hypothetical protein n=1 Tax=Acidaminobacter sp. JC074 TaxID=2530199 RepID=UPI001F0EE28E|nr:hypothetical protein [Acidaminobacter sp. JC074]MCH4886166.1 hypothetical protein [Acidaminobacter sp. JC074]